MGQEHEVAMEQWIYEVNADNSSRFILGINGQKPLVCVGVNPSTAAPGSLDQTVGKVSGFARLNGYDSWVMLNLYPQRATDPKSLHAQPQPGLKRENERRIREYIADRRLTLLGAWGGLITSRAYLPDMLAGIVQIADESSCDWVSIGEPITGGHPRHPARPSYTLPLQSFDMDFYLRCLNPGRST